MRARESINDFTQNPDLELCERAAWQPARRFRQKDDRQHPNQALLCGFAFLGTLIPLKYKAEPSISCPDK